jgi:hypothetical protein
MEEEERTWFAEQTVEVIKRLMKGNQPIDTDAMTEALQGMALEYMFAVEKRSNSPSSKKPPPDRKESPPVVQEKRPLKKEVRVIEANRIALQKWHNSDVRDYGGSGIEDQGIDFDENGKPFERKIPFNKKGKEHKEREDAGPSKRPALSRAAGGGPPGDNDPDGDDGEDNGDSSYGDNEEDMSQTPSESEDDIEGEEASPPVRKTSTIRTRRATSGQSRSQSGPDERSTP